MRNENKRQDIGARSVHSFLAEVPGVTLNSVIEQLASLKAAGHYATIIREAQEEADAELLAALLLSTRVCNPQARSPSDQRLQGIVEFNPN